MFFNHKKMNNGNEIKKTPTSNTPKCHAGKIDFLATVATTTTATMGTKKGKPSKLIV